MDYLMFGAISGSTLLSLFVQIVIAALIFWVLTWALEKIGIPEPFNKILRVLLILVAVVIVINALLSLTGNAFIRF